MCMHIIYIHKICIIYVYIYMYVYCIQYTDLSSTGSGKSSCLRDDLESSLNFWKMWSLSLAYTKPWGRKHMSYIYIVFLFFSFRHPVAVAAAYCRVQFQVLTALPQNQPLCVGHIDIYIYILSLYMSLYIYIIIYIYHYIYISLYIYIIICQVYKIH